MRLTSRPLLRAFTVLAASLLASAAQARMEPMEDSELSEVTGQAFINLATDSNLGINYTRINLGMKLETQLNMQKLKLGIYPRTGEGANPADILIDNFALGTVNDATGTVNPFLINDPFIEMAYSGDKIVGMRVGFGEAKGTLSGDIKNLTGSVPMHIKGTGAALYEKANWFQDRALEVAGVNYDSIMEADAELVTPGGSPDAIRATHAGIRNGQGLKCTSGCAGGWTDGLLSIINSSNCGILGIATCFPLTNFKSIPVGDLAMLDSAGTAALEGAAKGFFISLQTQAVAWKDLDSGAFQDALATGAYMNIPKSGGKAPIQVDFTQALNGINRSDTCFGAASAGC